jgi:uncharacterized protein
MTAVFADTFYFLALVNPKDRAHARAIALTSILHGQLVTTEWVLTEFGDALSHPPNRQEFVSTLQDLRQNPQVTIVPSDTALFEDGVQHFAERSDKEWSLTDCISFVVMQQKGITEALTGDHHFEQAGFTALLK